MKSLLTFQFPILVQTRYFLLSLVLLCEENANPTAVIAVTLQFTEAFAMHSRLFCDRR